MMARIATYQDRLYQEVVVLVGTISNMESAYWGKLTRAIFGAGFAWTCGRVFGCAHRSHTFIVRDS
jgi:hypothetical protein